MPDAVNPRSYDNSRRTEAARQTRRSIVDAARELFVESGYPATTLAAIASRAGVSVQTVYFQFGNKLAVLKEVVDQTVAGDDEPRPLSQREWVQEILDEPDPRTKLRLNARAVSRIVARTAPIARMLRSAAEVDPEAAEQWKKGVRQRHAGMHELADHLRATGHLRADLTPAAAADRLAVLIDPEIYRLTVGEHGWTAGEYETWLSELMIASLLSTDLLSSDLDS
jgi:AcrR family transcriptional regulator